ncbi:ATP synthase F1 subunit epsilon [Microgenomates group bacterium]|nr:ATP synthase F1 subunit epsilon [Microgenomates group bacterium]
MIQLSVNTPERNVFAGEVYEVLLPTTEGEVGILPNHTPYLAALKAGEVSIRRKKEDNNWQHLVISLGIAEFSDNELTVLSRSAEKVEEIDLDQAKQARKEAEELMKKKDRLNVEEVASLTARMERELTRIRVSEKYRRRKI